MNTATETVDLQAPPAAIVFTDAAAAKVKESVQAEISTGLGGMPFPPGMLGGL